MTDILEIIHEPLSYYHIFNHYDLNDPDSLDKLTNYLQTHKTKPKRMKTLAYWILGVIIGYTLIKTITHCYYQYIQE